MWKLPLGLDTVITRDEVKKTIETMITRSYDDPGYATSTRQLMDPNGSVDAYADPDHLELTLLYTIIENATLDIINSRSPHATYAFTDAVLDACSTDLIGTLQRPDFLDTLLKDIRKIYTANKQQGPGLLDGYLLFMLVMTLLAIKNYGNITQAQRTIKQHVMVQVDSQRWILLDRSMIEKALTDAGESLRDELVMNGYEPRIEHGMIEVMTDAMCRLVGIEN